MEVFLAGIMQGSLQTDDIHSQDWRDHIREVLARHVPDANVYCHYSQHPNSLTYGPKDIRRTFVDGIRRAAESDLVIAYCPSASMGTAVEIYEAYRNGAIVLTVSPLAVNWMLQCYSHRIFPTFATLDEFLASGGLETLSPGDAHDTPVTDPA